MNSDILRADIETYAARLRGNEGLLQAARRGELRPDAVAAYVRGLRDLIAQTPAMLDLAMRSAEQAGRADLVEHFAQKKREEDGHERWADDDLRGLSSEFAISIPTSSSPALRRLIDFLIQATAANPANYLAYMLLAEYVTVLVGPEWLGALERSCGISKRYLSVVDHHVELDSEHALDGSSEIDRLTSHRELHGMRETITRASAHLDQFCIELVAVGAAA